MKAGASVKAVTRIGGMTPLFLAAKTGNAQIVGSLLKAGATATEANANGTTVLMIAARLATAPPSVCCSMPGASGSERERCHERADRADVRRGAQQRRSREAPAGAKGRPVGDHEGRRVEARARRRERDTALPESEAKPTAAAAQPEKLPGVGFNKDGTPIRDNNDERVFGRDGGRRHDRAAFRGA